MQPERKKSFRGMLYRKLKTEKPSVYPKFVIEQEKLSAIVPREEVKDHHVVYPLIKPFAYASIKWDSTDNAMVYSIVEPAVSEEDKHILEKLKEGLIQIINVSFEDIRNHTTMIDFLEEHVRKLLYEYDFAVSQERYMGIMYYIFRDFIGLNEVEPFLRDPYIEDIGADGVNIPVYVVHQKYGSLRTNIIYHDEEKLKEFVTKLAERCDRYISYAEPLLDGTLPDGTRVHASLAGDVTTRGPTFSIRKFRETPFTPVDMVKMNTASPEMLAYLWFVVQNSSNILITGGVSTGKTSLLNCLSLFIPPEAKVVSIEDTRELSLPHENWIPGVARTGFSGTGVGEVTMFELLRESFRQNPDYLIVGEIRGKEAYVMFQAMASGHPSMATMHAGSIDDVIKRLQTHPINLSAGLLESLDVILVMVHAREKGKSARRVKEVVELQSVDVESGRARALKSFVWLPALDTFEYRGESWVLHKISKEKGIPMDKIMKEISQRKKLINWMVENNIVAINDVVKYIYLYSRNPEKLKEIIGTSE
jgi:flagellar protein FlaI